VTFEIFVVINFFRWNALITQRSENLRKAGKLSTIAIPGIRTLVALLILREQVIKPVLAGVCRPKRGRPPKNLDPLDVHYQKLKVEMLATLRTLKIAA